METIVHYQLLLLKNWSHETNVKQTSEDCISLLKRLEELDPMRKMRYEELGECIVRSWIDAIDSYSLGALELHPQ
jgi:geranylgeranyl transferase type-2 subunit alpha